jgi:hypothetical protein
MARLNRSLRDLTNIPSRDKRTTPLPPNQRQTCLKKQMLQLDVKDLGVISYPFKLGLRSQRYSSRSAHSSLACELRLGPVDFRPIAVNEGNEFVT